MRTTPLAVFALLSVSLPAWAQPAPPPVPPPPPPAEPVPEPAPEPPPAPAAPPPVPEAPPAAPVAPPPPVVREPERTVVEDQPARVEADAVHEPAPPKRLAVGKQGFFQPSALLQGWFFTAREREWETTFRIRRAELRIKGEIVPDFIGYSVMIDPAKVLEPDEVDKPVAGQEPEPTTPGTVTVEEAPGALSVFQDFYITFITEFVDVSLGQFKTPMSWEGYNSSSKLLFPERALVSREYGDVRDLGLRLEKKIGPVHYYAGLFNGTRLNRRDDNDQKDAALRVEVSPLDWLMIGAVGYTSIGERDQETTRDAVEGDLRIEYEGALLQAEYIRQWLGSNTARREQGHGFYGAAGYTFADTYQPVARVGVLDESVHFKDDHTWHYELGFNYYIEKHEAKLQASYGLFDRAVGETRHELILAAQVSF